MMNFFMYMLSSILIIAVKFYISHQVICKILNINLQINYKK